MLPAGKNIKGSFIVVSRKRLCALFVAVGISSVILIAHSNQDNYISYSDDDSGSDDGSDRWRDWFDNLGGDEGFGGQIFFSK